MPTTRTRIARLAAAAALVLSLGSLAAGPALARGTTMSAGPAGPPIPNRVEVMLSQN